MSNNNQSEKKRLTRKAAFLKWAAETPGFGHYTELTVLRNMENIETYIGCAWAAWKAAWRLRS